MIKNRKIQDDIQINNPQEFFDRFHVAKGYFESTCILLGDIDDSNSKIATVGYPLIYNFKHCLELVGKLTEWILTGSTNNEKHSISSIITRTNNKIIAKYNIKDDRYQHDIDYQVVMSEDQRRFVEAKKDFVSNIDSLSKEVKEAVISTLSGSMQFTIKDINNILTKYVDYSDVNNTKSRYGNMKYAEKKDIICEIKKDIKAVESIIGFYESVIWSSFIKKISVEGTDFKVELKKFGDGLS